MTSAKVTFLFFKEGNTWVGQCLEYDIAAQAESLSEARRELETSFVARLVYAVEHSINKPFKGLPRAPGKYWNMYKQMHGERLERQKLPVFKVKEGGGRRRPIKNPAVQYVVV